MADETREQIVRAAEVLFAQDGYAGTSLRHITEAANVNIAAVNYHFGSKENLLIEILDRVIGPINDDRLRLLDEAEAEGIPDAGRILTAFLLPDLHALDRLRSRNPALPKFVSRMYSEGSELMGQVMGRQFAEIQRRFYAAFANALPDLTSDEIAWRLHCVVGIVVYLFAGVEAPGMASIIGPDIDRNLKQLLGLTLALMTAPTERLSAL